MSIDVLAEALAANAHTASESEAITALVSAYEKFAKDAMAGALPLLPAGLALGVTAMSEGLVGMSAANAGLLLFPASITSFWLAVAGGLATSFAGATAVVPPPHTDLPAQFQDAVKDNIENVRNAEDSYRAIAQILYDNAVIGGVVTVVTPTFPIL
ncbi:MAG: hypothetical protein L3J47_00420 [Sulfurovum sp.]|nr:hypothetical protein [Sulfurovum sp.]